MPVDQWSLGVAVLALLVAGFAAGLELRRYLGEGVHLRLSVMANARCHPEPPGTFLMLSVYNRGDQPTTLTHMVLEYYPTRLGPWLPVWIRRLYAKHKREVSVVLPPGVLLPHVLKPGTIWTGLVRHTPKLAAEIATGRLYAGVAASHSNQHHLIQVVCRSDPAAAPSRDA